jgi:hypothetical protein
MGAKYQPSIIYKVRHVAVKCDQLEGVIPAVVGIDTGLSPKAVQGANA